MIHVGTVATRPWAGYRYPKNLPRRKTMSAVVPFHMLHLRSVISAGDNISAISPHELPASHRDLARWRVCTIGGAFELTAALVI